MDTSPPSDNHILISFFTCIKQELGSISTPRQKTYSNLTLKEKTTLNNLKNKESILIKPCDKGGGISIMNTRDYLTEIHTHLQDHNTCKLIAHNTTNGIAHDVCITFATHNRHNHHGISTASQEYTHTSLLRVTKNTQAKLPFPLCCFRM